MQGSQFSFKLFCLKTKGTRNLLHSLLLVDAAAVTLSFPAGTAGTHLPWASTFAPLCAEQNAHRGNTCQRPSITEHVTFLSVHHMIES